MSGCKASVLPEWSHSALSGLSHDLNPPKPEAYTLNPLDTKHDIWIKPSRPSNKSTFRASIGGGGGGGGALNI